MKEDQVLRSARLCFMEFTFDPVSLELWRNGDAVHLSPQPARVLAMLAERSGRLVTTEELRERLWGDGVHVDFAGSVHSCVGQLRRALGDDARKPRVIETLRRRGYRFVAEIAEEPTVPAAPELGARPSPVALPAPAIVTQPLRAIPASPPRRVATAAARAALVLGLAVLGLASGAGVWWQAAPAESVGTAAADFEVLSVAVLPIGDVADEGGRIHLAAGGKLTEQLLVQLARLPRERFRVVARAPVGGPTAQLERADLVVDGNVRSDGEYASVFVRLMRPATGEVVWAETFTGTVAAVADLATQAAQRVHGVVLELPALPLG